MKAKAKVFLALFCAGILLLGAFVFLSGRRKFPMWEIAEEKPVSSGVVLTFVELERENEYDVVVINMKNAGERDVYHGYNSSIEYLKEGIWYTVYGPGGPSIEGCLLPHEETAYRCSVPSGLLDTPGMYRIYIDGAGYCEIAKGADNEK